MATSKRGNWTWQRMVKRPVEVLRKEGFKSFWFKVLEEVIYRRVFLFERFLNEPIPNTTSQLPVDVRLLKETEVEDYICFQQKADPLDIRRRLKAGQWCFTARHAGRIVHACWAVTGRAWVEYLDREVQLSRNEVYIYESYTSPAFRGQNISSVRGIQMLRYFKKSGYWRMIAVIYPENKPGIRPAEKLGYHLFGLMGYYQIGPWRYDFCRVYNNSPAPGDVATQCVRDLGQLYWDQILEEVHRGPPIDIWRAYMGKVYSRLIQDWFPNISHGRSLKTDLFEESVSSHYPLSDLEPGCLGLDYSPAVARAAHKRLLEENGQHLFVVGDLRRVPLKSASVDRILSGSSLDHFKDKADIAKSMAELARVLVPGGIMVITLDNPHNPVVWLRNHLPFSWLNCVRLLPYYVGATYNRREIRHHLEVLGLVLTDMTAVAHVPRAPAIWLVRAAEHLDRAPLKAFITRCLDALEKLGRYSTRYRTGYYLALRIEKPLSSVRTTIL